MIRIAEIFGAIGVGQFHRFRHEMNRRGRIGAKARERKALQHIEKFDDMNPAGRGRRHGGDLIAAIGAMQGRPFDRAVGFRDRPASSGRRRRGRSRRFFPRPDLRRRRARHRGRSLRGRRRDRFERACRRARAAFQSGCRKIRAVDGQRCSRACTRGSESARSSSTSMPERASAAAGAASSASENLPEP